MKKEVVTVRIPTNLKEKLKRVALQKGLTLNAVIVDSLWKTK